MSDEEYTDEIEGEGDKIVVFECPDCKAKDIYHRFSCVVPRRTEPKYFVRDLRCPNCGKRGLTFIKERDME